MYDFPDTEPKEYSFDLLEIGYYSVVIDEYEETTTKAGARIIIVTYKVTGKIENGEIEPCQNKLIWHNIVFPSDYDNQDDPEKAAFMFELIRKFLKTIGEKYKGQIVIDPRRWMGKELAVKIKHDEWMGEIKEKVHYPLTIEKALAISLKHKSNITNKIPEMANSDDNIPFLS